MKNLIKKFIREEEGASAAEYAILLAIIGIVIVTAAKTLSNAISGAMNEAANVIGF